MSTNQPNQENQEKVEQQNSQEQDTQQKSTAPDQTQKDNIPAKSHPPDRSDDEPVKVIPLAELTEEAEYNSEEKAFMTKLYEETMQQIKSGEIISGRIVSITDREVAIDIGFKSEGTVPIEEFENREGLKIGDEVEVFLEDIEDQDGQLVLSKKKADFSRIWQNIMDIYERGDTVKGICMRRIKGGIVVDVMGVDAFLPGSQIDIHPVRDFDAWIGQTCDFRVVKVNEMRKNIVLSRKAIIEDNLRDVREKILSEIQIGQIVQGVVKNITDFGAFVDLGGVDGLLHITDLSWGRLNHPSEVVSYDQKLDVRILDFDPVRKRISVGLKQLQKHPWEGIEKRFPVNSKVKGRVVSITKYGAFVELEEGIEGLIHISEMSWTQHIKHPSQILNIGQDVEVIVLSIDVENRKVSLGLKQTEEDPWEKLEQKYAVGSIHKGIVRDLVPFGAFVELEEGVEGLVHISDLSWTRKVRHPGEIVKKEDEIEVTILSFDRNERRIALGHKQTQENPWLLFEKKFPLGSVVEGKVSRTVDKGAIIELEWNLESFLPVSHFGKDQQTGRGKALKEGETLRVEIIDFDRDNKKIVVSASNVQKREDEKEYQEYLEGQKESSETDKKEVTPEETAEAKPAKKEKVKKTKESAEEKEKVVSEEPSAPEEGKEVVEVEESADVKVKSEEKKVKKPVAKAKKSKDKSAAGKPDKEETTEKKSSKSNKEKKTSKVKETEASVEKEEKKKSKSVKTTKKEKIAKTPTEENSKDEKPDESET